MAQAKRKLRISSRHQEIFSVIEAAKKGSQNFVWKMIGNKRQTFQIQIVKIDDQKNQIEIKLREYTPHIAKDDVLYLKLDSRESAFKAEVQERVGPKVILNFPSEMVLSENRNSPRYYFHPTDDKFLQLRRVKNQASLLSEKSHSLLVCDISESGICVFVNPQNEHWFQVKGKVKIESLGLFRLEKPIIGEILFKMPTKIKGALATESGFKFGIQLDSKIPKILIDRFILKKNLFSVSDERVVRDQAFRRKVSESVTQLRKKMSGKKNLKALFESLDKPNSDSQYLKQHIHMLCEVMAGLGSKVGWVSEGTIDKLIYVAYLHDIRFANCPRVAKIATKKEFDQIKHTLLESERKAFLEAPAYAAEMARQDSDAYPDAIKILLQQKELPDGSGFPHGLTSKLLSPLSCLFILSHFFVDYVLDHPDWSVDDFIKTYQKKLKGPYFLKLFQAL